MNYLGSFSTFDSAYYSLLRKVLSEGAKFSPRDTKCIEIRPACFDLTQPKLSLYSGSERRLNYRFWVVEALGYLTGRNDRSYANLLCATNGKYREYLDEDGYLAGAYGPKIREGLQNVYLKLTADPWSRQALVSIWSPLEDLGQLNLMCTVSLHFFQTEKGLDLHVYMRSNDLNWGTPYDIPAFCFLQTMMAAALNVPVGTYHHTAGSFHIYEENMPKVEPVYSDKPVGIREDLRFPNYVDVTWNAVLREANCYLEALIIQFEDGQEFRNFSFKESPFSWMDSLVRFGRGK